MPISARHFRCLSLFFTLAAITRFADATDMPRRRYFAVALRYARVLMFTRGAPCLARYRALLVYSDMRLRYAERDMPRRASAAAITARLFDIVAAALRAIASARRHGLCALCYFYAMIFVFMHADDDLIYDAMRQLPYAARYAIRATPCHAIRCCCYIVFSAIFQRLPITPDLLRCFTIDLCFSFSIRR